MNQRGIHLPEGLALRPVRASDSGFIESLYRSTRGDLRLIDADKDFVEGLIDQQFKAQCVGYGEAYPDAMHFIVEKQHESVGRLILNFGHNEVRVVDIAFVEKARGKGFGQAVLRGLQLAASSVGAPLVLSVHPANLRAKRLYAGLGFRVEQSTPLAERMAWYPASVHAGIPA
jgi:ribosomal protein S18 acetylase RimI-like enzyme